MSYTRIAEESIRRLKDYDVTLAYCEKMCAPVKRRGHTATCACPFGTHTQKNHLALAVKDGIGVAHCHACGGGGNVFHIAAAVLGIDPKGRGNFVKLAHHIADTVGITLREAAPNGETYRRKPTPCRKPAPAAIPEPLPPVTQYLSPEDEAIALAAVRFAASRDDLLAEHAERLQLPLATMQAHTSLEPALADGGMIGLAPDGRLLYVYTVRDDSGNLRVVAVKLRGESAEEPKAVIRRGRWQSYGEMRYDSGKQARFIFSAGRACALFGIEAAKDAGIVILTEGESDKLACEASFSALYACYDGDGEQIPAEHMPAIVAKPCAKGFRAEHAPMFAGKLVIIAADGDAAGLNGAMATAALLHANRARVTIWTPPDGYKDARKYYAETAVSGFPNTLAHSLLNHSRPYTHEQA